MLNPMRLASILFALGGCAEQSPPVEAGPAGNLVVDSVTADWTLSFNDCVGCIPGYNGVVEYLRDVARPFVRPGTYASDTPDHARLGIAMFSLRVGVYGMEVGVHPTTNAVQGPANTSIGWTRSATTRVILGSADFQSGELVSEGSTALVLTTRWAVRLSFEDVQNGESLNRIAAGGRPGPALASVVVRVRYRRRI
jgi:hypothetical protein